MLIGNWGQVGLPRTDGAKRRLVRGIRDIKLKTIESGPIGPETIVLNFKICQKNFKQAFINITKVEQ